jgi:DNA-binding winged helix-turn-helix (wHTH) protein
VRVRGVLVEGTESYNNRGEKTVEIEIEPLRIGVTWNGYGFIPGDQAIIRQETGEKAYLKALEAKVFLSLVMRGGFASKDEIYLDAWGYIPTISRRIDVHVCNLRKALAPLGIQIVNRRNAGYSMSVVRQPQKMGFHNAKPIEVEGR